MYQRDDPNSRGYTQGYQTDSSNQRLCKIGLSLIVEQLWSVYETLYHRYFLSLCPFFPLYLITITCHSLLTASPVVRGGCFIACIHRECCFWTFQSNLIAFIMVIVMSFGCRFAQLHFLIWFLCVLLHFYDFKFFFFLLLLLGFKHLRKLQLPEMSSRLKIRSMFSKWKPCLVTYLGKLFSGQDGGI